MKFSTSAVVISSTLAQAGLGLGAVTSTKPSNASVNPFVGRDAFLSPVYTKEVLGAVADFTKAKKYDLAAKGLKVSRVPTFIWIAERAAVPNISKYLQQAKALNPFKPKLVQLVVYDLPDRDCSAKASDGEFHLVDGGADKYKEFIQAIKAEILKVPGVPIIISLEPDSIGNLVTNLGVEKCANAASAYQTLITYAVATLGPLPQVSIYIDAAHDGWLGWPDNLQPTANILGKILADAKAINPLATVRGVSTDVSNYNGFGNQNQAGHDELHYVQNLAPYLDAVGYPAHFIVDQGRSGNQNATREGGDWCNFKYAGLGPRPTTNTGSPLVDSIVWVKPPGETDGTSNTTSPRFDTACVSPTSYQPTPESGGFLTPVFQFLIEQANPPF